MSIIVKFGDVFRHTEEDYVFLAQTDGIIYAAKILDEEKTAATQKLNEIRIKANNIQKTKHALYSYVILSTDDFKNRMAHFYNTDKNKFELSFDIICSLNKNDQKEIWKEILHENSAVPIKLKQLIKDIEIK